MLSDFSSESRRLYQVLGKDVVGHKCDSNLLESLGTLWLLVLVVMRFGPVASSRFGPDQAWKLKGAAFDALDAIGFRVTLAVTVLSLVGDVIGTSIKLTCIFWYRQGKSLKLLLCKQGISSARSVPIATGTHRTWLFLHRGALEVTARRNQVLGAEIHETWINRDRRIFKVELDTGSYAVILAFLVLFY